MMKTIAGLLFSLSAADAAILFHSNNTAVLQAHFNTFKSDFGREYESEEEEQTRFNVFVKNLQVIDERNAAEKQAGGNAEHGITRFSDLTKEEFQSRFLLSKPKKANAVDVQVPALKDNTVQVNWAGTLTTPVKDQGYCGSCCKSRFVDFVLCFLR